MSDTSEKAAWAASDAACYHYSGADQAPLREAFCNGSGWAAAEIERLRAALAPFAELGRQLNEAGEVSWPDGASAKYLRMDGIKARHFRDAAAAINQQDTTSEDGKASPSSIIALSGRP